MLKKKFKQDLLEAVQEIVKNGYKAHERMKLSSDVIMESSFEDFHYQTAAFIKCSIHWKEALVNELKKKEYYKKVQWTGPGFLSIQYDWQYKHWDKCMDFNESHACKKEKVVVDYCGVNVAKKMHVGHIRSMIQGDFVVRLHESHGDDVIRVNHAGDWGNQFGYLIAYLLEQEGEVDSLNKKCCWTNEQLTTAYKEAYEKQKTDEVFKLKGQKVAFELQHKTNQRVHDIWRYCVDVSLEEAEKTWKFLGLNLSKKDTRGESFYATFLNEIIEDLLSKGIAKKSEDAVVVFFKDKSPLVLQKANGNFLYALFDIAALKWRQEHWNPDKIIYVVDNRQSLHFEQVFDVVRQANYIKPDVQLIHLGFGAIIGEDKKPLKTKEGQALYLEELLWVGEKQLENQDFFKNFKNEKALKHDWLKKSLVGGLKFYDLKMNRHMDYAFNWDYVLNFSGGSAPYIQQSIMRMQSLMDKYDQAKENVAKQEVDGLALNKDKGVQNQGWWLTLGEGFEKEKKIGFQILKCKERAIESLHKDYNAVPIIEGLLEAVHGFHHYYETEKILGSLEEEKKMRWIKGLHDEVVRIMQWLGIEIFSRH